MRRLTVIVVTLLSLGCTANDPSCADPAPAAPSKASVYLGALKKGSDWPGFLGPTADGRSTEKGIIQPWPDDGLKVVWHKEVGDGYAMPSIANGKLYHFDRVDNSARVTCMDAESGKQVWQFKYPTDYRDRYNYSGGPRCCPVIDDGLVFVYGAGGMLHCLDAEKGKVVWKVDTTKKYGVIQNFFGVGSTPVVEGDLLIVQIGGSPKGSEDVDFSELKSNGTGVVAFDKKTGKEKWRVGNELASYSVPVLTSINKQRLCLVYARGGLLAIDPKTGKQVFHFPRRAKAYESVNASNPVVVGDRVFLSETYGPGGVLLKIEDGKPKIVWDDANKGRDKSMQCHWNTPIVVDGYLYACSGRHETDGELRCIELATGKVMWSKPGLARTSLTLIDGHFICLGEYGIVRLLRVNPKKYDEVSTMVVREADANGDQKLDGEVLLRTPCWAAPIVSHGLLYLRGKGRLVCLQLIPKGKK